MKAFIIILISILFWSCNSQEAAPKQETTLSPKEEENTTVKIEDKKSQAKIEAGPKDIKKHNILTCSIPPHKHVQNPIINTANTYAWKNDYKVANALINRFDTPEGYTRKNYDDFPIADWLRHLPLLPEGSPVKYYNGGEKPNQVHEAVLDIDIGKRDLQQCADAVMRLKAEYHFSKKDYGNIHFNYTSGDKVAFNDWMQGKKPRVSGNKVTFTAKNGNADTSHKNFRKYMDAIYNYAGTASLEKELKKVSIADIRPGDVFIQGGFPGHAVIVVDVAENAAGEKLFMIAQSYMPAQSIHILKNENDPMSSPWYQANFGEILDTPEWRFNATDLKRFQ